MKVRFVPDHKVPDRIRNVRGATKRSSDEAFSLTKDSFILGGQLKRREKKKKLEMKEAEKEKAHKNIERRKKEESDKADKERRERREKKRKQNQEAERDLEQVKQVDKYKIKPETEAAWKAEPPRKKPAVSYHSEMRNFLSEEDKLLVKQKAEQMKKALGIGPSQGKQMSEEKVKKAVGTDEVKVKKKAETNEINDVLEEMADIKEQKGEKVMKEKDKVMKEKKISVEKAEDHVEKDKQSSRKAESKDKKENKMPKKISENTMDKSISKGKPDKKEDIVKSSQGRKDSGEKLKVCKEVQKPVNIKESRCFDNFLDAAFEVKPKPRTAWSAGQGPAAGSKTVSKQASPLQAKRLRWQDAEGGELVVVRYFEKEELTDTLEQVQGGDRGFEELRSADRAGERRRLGELQLLAGPPWPPLRRLADCGGVKAERGGRSTERAGQRERERCTLPHLWAAAGAVTPSEPEVAAAGRTLALIPSRDRSGRPDMRDYSNAGWPATVVKVASQGVERRVETSKMMGETVGRVGEGKAPGKMPCRYMTSLGWCRNGDSCRFLHS